MILVALPVRRIAIVGCGASKRATAAPARELYTSTLFKLARAYAETFDAWYVASARYGLCEPEQELLPYNDKVSTKHARQWAQAVSNALVCTLVQPHREPWNRPDHARTWPLNVEVHILAGQRYADPIADALETRVRGVRTPLTGLGIGARLAWLKRARELAR